MPTKIKYVDETCNAVIGCSKCSPACKNCWAVKVVDRLWLCQKKEKYREACHLEEWTGRAVVDFDAFKKCKGRKPKTFLLSSLGDWLHESLNISVYKALLNNTANYPQHRFYTLTKRPERWKELGPIPPNVWLGASVWDQVSYLKATESYLAMADDTVKLWLSMEPLLGLIDLTEFCKANWIVVGAESGKDRRPCKIEWIRSIVRQCKETKIPIFVKQIDYNGKLLKDPLDWPMRVTVQDLPK
jgi:protein gp37